MDTSNYFSTTSKLCTNPLKDETNIAALKTLEVIIRTSVGPYGKLKAVQNVSGGYVTITSSSQRLFHIISIKNILLKLIISSTKIHLNYFKDNGLCCSLLTLKLINKSLSAVYPLPLIGKLIEYFGKIYIEYLNVDKNSCIQIMDLSNLSHFESVVLSILQSKPGCILRSKDRQHLCILLMKAFLNCIPSSPSSIYYKNINIITLEGISCDKSCLYNGLLVRLSEMPLKKLNHLYSKSNIKIVLFTSSLSGDANFPVHNIEAIDHIDVWDAVLVTMKSALNKLIHSGIHMLACQKVVHPSLRKLLEEADILVLDRLGFEAAKHLEYLSGASNSSLCDEPSVGILSCVRQVTVGKTEYLLLSNEAKPFSTILVCNFNEQVTTETKVVCQQVIDTLIHLLKKPFVCFGAGCTEVHTSKLVEQKVLKTLEDIQLEIKCTTAQILEALWVFHQSIVGLAIALHQGSQLNFATETVFGHLWKLDDGNFPSGSDTCCCGQFSAIHVNSDWKIFTKSDYEIANVSGFHPLKPDGKIAKSAILDELSSKINAYSLGFDTASLLLRTSICISN